MLLMSLDAAGIMIDDALKAASAELGERLASKHMSAFVLV